MDLVLTFVAFGEHCLVAGGKALLVSAPLLFAVSVAIGLSQKK
jgi:phosphotransferase system  glucose/maltose/N-acetylglucosamine-specific IIC component